MNDAAIDEAWRTFCETIAAGLVDTVLAEARRQGVSDADAAQGLIVFSAELAQVVLETVNHLLEGGK